MNGVDCTFELRLKQAMEMVGFTARIRQIFSVLSAVLHIGNIQYVKKASSYHHDESVIIQNRDVLAMVASLLQVNEELLHSALISKCAIAYNEALIMNYKLPEAVNARDALAKLLYCSLFDWIVNQTNRLLSSGSKIAKDKEVSIGVLDIFGFENFERNSFEQFCINYANEHLQSYFNLHVFKYEQEEYLNEGIEWNKIAYTDNTPCLDLIQQKPYGLLPLLNEECNFPGATNETLLEKYRRHQVTNEYFDSPQKRENAFIVHHYAGTVKYDVKNFREKNSDANRAADLVTLLKTSLSGFLREMVAESPTAMARWRMLKLTVFTVLAFTRKVRRRSSFSLEGLSSSPPKGAMVLAERGSLTGGSIQGKAPVPLGVKRNFSPQSVSRQHRTMDLPSHVPSGKPRRGITNQTVTSQFQLSLTRLMEALNKADPYFIRCIKSNNSKTPGLFDEETVLRQLRYSGMLETVRIRQSGYHIRLTYKEFTSLYHALLPEDFRDDQNAFRRCFLHWGLDPENFQIGKRKIYLRETEKQKLDDILHKFVLRNIIRIQRWWRVSNHQLKEKSAVAIQRHWRGYVVRNDYRRTRVATLMIQRWWRAAQRRKSARRFARNVERKPAIMEEEDTNDEDLERVAASSSPLSHTTNGHATPFSSFSSDWNSNHSDDGISGPPLTKTTSTEDVRSPGRLIISIVPGSRTPLRRESYAAPDRFRRDSEEESSGILDDSEPESYQPHQFSKLKRDSRHEHAPAGFMVPRVEPKPWRRYSAIEPPPQHSVSEPQTPPAEKVQERGVDVFNEKPIDVYNEKGVDVKEEISQHIRPSPPRQIPLGHQRTTRRDTLPKREHFTVDPVLQQQQSGKGKMGVFKNWLEKKVAPKKKSLAGGDLESLRLSPDLDEADEEPRTILTRGSAGRTPMKSNAHNSLISRLSPPRKSFSPKTLAKRAKSASGKAAVFETSSTSSSSSILQPLQRTFSKNRLRRRITADPESTGSQKSTSTKEQSWNCRSITEFTDSEDRVVSSAEELRELETFIFDKILQMDSGTKGKTSTKADQIFQQALKEFRNNLISTYSVAVKDVRLCIRYRDLIVNFEKTIRVACYKIIQSQSPPYTTAALAKYKTDADAFPVNLALNAFRSFMNEFMQRQQTKMKLDESTKYRTLSRKRKVEQSILNKNGHQLVSVNIFNLPTACEVCSSFLWPMEKGLVCQLCKTTCHKKCYQKIENSCTGKRKIKKSTTAGGALALPAQLGPSQPSGRIFCVPLDCLLLHGEKIPAIADRMITVIELQGVYTEWIYRKSGGIPGMRTLRAAIEENCEKIDWDQYHDSGIHVVASTFKALLREMPEPLMTFERYDEIMDIMENDNEEDQLQNVYVSIRKMPKSNHDLLERLFFHLARIAQHSDVNQMNAENLAIIFAPVLFKADRDLRAFEVSDNYKKQIKCIQIVIDAQLQKLQLTLEDIGQIDSAAMTANTRLSVIRSSKVYIGKLQHQHRDRQHPRNHPRCGRGGVPSVHRNSVAPKRKRKTHDGFG
ncbi:Unconventional myosin-IXb [Hypsibius exemplaris]|uniref:Unconventional myosin-IXb n=1 Tax=Hypsibius exemplaris TaxID=2072580 RepID=A0A1W0WPL2_HYPEX|nr:Unconventional myosin-IXb [Hypsibius exemplaris]